MAPQVQNLTDIISGLNGVYDPQRAAAQTQINATQDAGTAAEAGVNAAKDSAFNGITNSANARGMLFSGFAPDQQAKYTASTYLPTLLNLHAKTADNVSKLQQAILGLNTQQQTQAQGIQGQQKTDLNNFNISQQQAQDNATKLAQELAIAQMNNQTKLQAANISASSKSAPVPAASAIQQADAQALSGKLSSMAGKDGYISPQAYAQGLQLWQSAGHDQKTYDSLFSGLRNPNNTHYRLSSGWGG